MPKSTSAELATSKLRQFRLLFLYLLLKLAHLPRELQLRPLHGTDPPQHCRGQRRVFDVRRGLAHAAPPEEWVARSGW